VTPLLCDVGGCDQLAKAGCGVAFQNRCADHCGPFTAVTETVFRKGIKGLQPHPEQPFLLGPPAPVEVCQLEAEFGGVLALYRDARPSHVLEIGTASGGTLFHWLATAPAGATVVTVDLAEPHYESSEHLYDGWTPDGVVCVQVRGSSHDPETLEACRKHAPYEWLFIDGAHTYEDARMDWDDYGALCAPGAFVFFHDIALRRRYEDGSEAGVWRLWRELQAEGFWTAELRARPFVDAYGIGVLRLPT
jgi:predicted O-methyltransferase YrrM